MNSNDLKVKKSIYLEDFAKRNWETCERMRMTRHSFSRHRQNPFHLEDDVWTHSLLVLNAIQPTGSMPEKAMFNLAMTHDYGKILTRTCRDDGRVSFFGHSFHSTQFTIDNLLDDFVHEIVTESFSESDLNRFISCAALVSGNHDLCYQFDGNPEKVAKILHYDSGFLDCFQAFARADFEGRFFASGRGSFDKGGFSEFLETDVKKEIEENNPGYTPEDVSIWLVGGIPGSGKDYLANDRLGIPLERIFSNDLARIQKYMKDMIEKDRANDIPHHPNVLYHAAFEATKRKDAKRILENHEELMNSNPTPENPIAFTATMTTSKSRAGYIDFFRRKFGNVKIGMLFVLLDREKAYIQDRARKDVSKEVGVSVIDKFAFQIQLPTYLENLGYIELFPNIRRFRF